MPVQLVDYQTAMTKAVEAVYEDGLLGPWEPLDLAEHQRVKVALQPDLPITPEVKQLSTAAPDEIDWLDADCVRQCAADADEDVGLESVRQALSKIPGSLTADFVAERDDR